MPPLFRPLIQTCVCTLACLVALCCAAADDLATTVRKLVRQLDAPQAAQRLAAEEQLRALGPAALAVLPSADDDLSAEVRTRLARVRQALQQNAAAAAGQASLVTLREKQRPLSELLAALATQTGNRLVDARPGRGQPAADPKLSVELVALPFWQALDQLLDLAQLDADPFGGDGAIHIVARADRARPRAQRASYSGPFRIEPLRIVAQRDLRGSENGALQVLLEIAWEPRLRPITVVQRARQVTATDESGRNVPVENPQVVLEPGVRRTTAALQMPLLFALPPRATREIARLQGTLHALLPGRVETFRFALSAQARHQELRIAGATVTLARAERENDLWSVETLLRFDRPDVALESHRGWVFDNRAALELRAGTQLAPLRAETLRQTENELGMKYLFERKTPLDECHFLYQTPVLILDADYPYEIQGLKLP